MEDGKIKGNISDSFQERISLTESSAVTNKDEFPSINISYCQTEQSKGREIPITHP